MTDASPLIEMLRSRGLTMATAESCTGGAVAAAITAVAGCSDVYPGGVVSYANSAKMHLLGVDAATLERYGAVSQQVVEAMAAGACKALGADCAMATSGIAGPGGAVPGKPVGTVWTAVATPAGVRSRLLHLSGERGEIVAQAVESVVAMAMEQI